MIVSLAIPEEQATGQGGSTLLLIENLAGTVFADDLAGRRRGDLLRLPNTNISMLDASDFRF